MDNDRDQGIGISPNKLLENTTALIDFFNNQESSNESITEILGSKLFDEHVNELTIHFFFNQAMALIEAGSKTTKQRISTDETLQIQLEFMRLRAMVIVGNLHVSEQRARDLLAHPTIKNLPVLQRNVMNLLGETQLNRGYPTEAIETFHRTLALPKTLGVDVSEQIMDSFFGLAWSHGLVGLIAEGKQYAQDGLDYYDEQPENLHEKALYLMIVQSWLSATSNDIEATRGYFEQALTLVEKKKVRIGRIALAHFQNLAATVAAQDHTNEALHIIERTVEIVRGEMGQSYPYLAHMLETKLSILSSQSNGHAMEPMLDEIDALRMGVFAEPHVEHLYSFLNRINLSAYSSDTPDNLTLLAVERLQYLNNEIPVPNLLKVKYLSVVADLQEQINDIKASEQTLLEMENLEELSIGSDAPARRPAHSQLAGFYQRTGDVKKSNLYLEKIRENTTQFYGVENIAISSYLLDQAKNVFNGGDYEQSLRYTTEAYLLIRSDSGSFLPIRIQLIEQINTLAATVPIDRTMYRIMLDDTIEISNRVLGKHNKYSIQLNQIRVRQLIRENRFMEAEALLKEQINHAVESVGIAHMDTQFLILNLASTYMTKGDYGNAWELFNHLYQNNGGESYDDRLMTTLALKGSASIHAAHEQYEMELQQHQEIDRVETMLYPESDVRRHPTYRDLGGVYGKLGQWELAYTYLSKLPLEGLIPYSYFESGEHGRILKMNSVLTEKIRSGFKVYQSKSDGAQRKPLAEEGFLLAQRLMQSQAAVSIAKTNARRQNTSPVLDALAREYEATKQHDTELNRQLLGVVEDRRNKNQTADLDALQVQSLESRKKLQKLRSDLQEEFPEYLALVDPRHTPVSEIQSQLRDDEVLMVFLELDYFKTTDPVPLGLTWAITADSIQWEESSIGSFVSETFLAVLRCGVDATRWQSPEKGRECEEVLAYKGDRVPVTGSTTHLPFDLEQSQQLYEELFTPFQSLIAGKKLLIVTHGALAKIPFSLLVKERPEGQFEESYSNEDDEYKRYQSTRWLVDDHAITHFPTVTTISSLRSANKKNLSGTRGDYLAFANPLLTGNESHPVFGDAQRQAGQEARRLQNCAIALKGGQSRISALLQSLFRRGNDSPQTVGNVIARESLMQLSPLPETAFEVCQTSESLGVGTRNILIGEHATESGLNKLDKSGELATFGVVHFATHGFQAGENGEHEAGLVLTPPEFPTEDDDGYLSASEIAALRFDADWVILSACNTAGGANTNNEPLSGLASAFFYANARSLLISHWQVVSEAAVELVTRTVAAESGQSRSESLRSAMISLKAQGGRRSHPSYWAPFVMVGDAR